MSELDVIGVLTGTDKSSSIAMAWDYLRHYEELFARWRHADINLIEIGVAVGSSLAAWERYFDRAMLVGVDINPDARAFARERVAIRIGSQENPGFLHGVAAEFPPTIVIDDGAHVAHMMIASFEVLFPALLPGGYYIFEDLSLHFEEADKRFEDARNHQGLADTHIFDYLAKFMRARAAYVDLPQKSWGFARYAYEQIDSVTVGGGFIAVRKKAARNVEQDVALFEHELERAPDRMVTGQRYAEYLLRHETRLDRAASLLTEIMAQQPYNEANCRTLLNVLLSLGRLDDAVDAASRLVGLSPGNAAYWDQLANIQRRRNRPDLELDAVQHLANLQPNTAGFRWRMSELHQTLGNPYAALAAAQTAAQLEPHNPQFRQRVADLGGD
jgi:tetratricopeptide (TPR) repeat protein